MTDSPMVFALALAATLAATPASAQEGRPAAANVDPGDARASLEDLERGFEKARRDWLSAYREAGTDEERRAVLAARPKAGDWFDRFLALADEHPGTDVAGEALAWVARHAEDGRPEVLRTLAAEHVDLPSLADVCRSFWYAESEVAREFLERCMEDSSIREVKGQACYSLAKVWKNRAALASRIASDPDAEERLARHYGAELLERILATGEKACRGKAEKLLERVVAEYADLEYIRDRKLGAKAEADLFEMRHLAVGQVAPEIEGESIHGEPMKLSDFRGKVVVLDFWGHW